MSKSWKKYRLGELAQMKYGKMPSKSERLKDGYPIFSGYGIVGYHSEYHYKEPTIIVVARGVGGAGDIKLSPPYSLSIR